jgi:hypothetical protein
LPADGRIKDETDSNQHLLILRYKEDAALISRNLNSYKFHFMAASVSYDQDPE